MPTEPTAAVEGALAAEVAVLIQVSLAGFAHALIQKLIQLDYGPEMAREHWHFEVACGADRFALHFRPPEDTP
jgi:hypothetical protein